MLIIQEAFASTDLNLISIIIKTSFLVKEKSYDCP